MLSIRCGEKIKNLEQGSGPGGSPYVNGLHFPSANISNVLCCSSSPICMHISRSVTMMESVCVCMCLCITLIMHLGWQVVCSLPTEKSPYHSRKINLYVLLQVVFFNVLLQVLCGVKENHSVEPLITQITLATATELEKENLEKENLPAPIILAPAPQRRERSFAPQNFVFKPLEGLMAYKVKPMSPSKADVFLLLNLCWSPAETTR